MTFALTLRTLQGILWLGLWLFSTAALAAPEVRVFGVQDELKEQVVLSIGAPTHDSERATRRFVEGLPDATKKALAAVGYFGAEVSTSRENSRDGDFVDVNIILGDPTRVNNIVLRIEGDAQLDRDFMSRIGDMPLKRNAIFLSADYESAKSKLLDIAQDLGYFNFDFAESSVRVSRKNLTADITLVALSGARFTFGQIRFDQTSFTTEFLDRWVPFQEGDPYESSKIGEAVTDFQKSGYFQSVRVLPQRDARYGNTVPVTVELERRDNNEVSIGIGYSSDTQLRTKLTWARPLVNRLGHSVEFGFGLSAIAQSATVSYRIPRRNQPLNNYFGIDFGLRNALELDTESFLSTLSFQRVRRLNSAWQESVFLRWERERFTIGDEDTVESDLVLPGISYTRSRSKGSPFLTWGQSSSFTLLGGSRELFSTVDLYKVEANFRYIRAVTDRNTLIFAAQYGAISSNDFDRVPVSQRFFAGGDRSVRGFRYLDVSPRNDEGDTVGGRYLEVVNLEHNYRFLDRWSSAVFVDAGRAFNTFDEPYSVGAGFGIRWQSPVGPFRLDLAIPISSNVEDRGVRVHFSLGPDL